eukprot:9108429-Ditylum_brightwellii.AAC.1
MEKVERQFKSNDNYINGTPFNLEDTNINVTFLKWADESNMYMSPGNKNYSKINTNAIDQVQQQENHNLDDVLSIQNIVKCKHYRGKLHK